jgi:hypothetical protein
VNRLLPSRRVEAEQADDGVARAVQKQHDRPRETREHVQWPGHRALRPGVCRAIVFGISSPKTMCRNVMSKKATATAAV